MNYGSPNAEQNILNILCFRRYYFDSKTAAKPGCSSAYVGRLAIEKQIRHARAYINYERHISLPSLPWMGCQLLYIIADVIRRHAY